MTGSVVRIEERVVLEQDVVARLASVANHGARAPFQLQHFPVKPGTFSVLGNSPAQDFMLGALSNVDGRVVGKLDYETGAGTLDWASINQDKGFWVRYSYRVPDA
jgi:hypothetical protein